MATIRSNDDEDQVDDEVDLEGLRHLAERDAGHQHHDVVGLQAVGPRLGAELAADLRKNRHELDPGPFFHGTKANLVVGDLLTAGFRSNYKAEIVMNHIYFTALSKGAGLAAEMAAGEGPPRVYVVEPTGPFENDPNVTDRKFPGNPTRSYRSRHPLKIVGELPAWELYDSEFIEQLRRRIKDGMGEIIN